jgi:hypothetical protein
VFINMDGGIRTIIETVAAAEAISTMQATGRFCEDLVFSQAGGEFFEVLIEAGWFYCAFLLRGIGRK